jgi:hypothetical protein
MLIHTELVYIVGPVIFAWLLVSLILRRRASAESDPAKRAWARQTVHDRNRNDVDRLVVCPAQHTVSVHVRISGGY